MTSGVYQRTEEHNTKIGQRRRGRKLSEEHKKKISESMKIAMEDKCLRERISTKLRGRKRSKEACLKQGVITKERFSKMSKEDKLKHLDKWIKAGQQASKMVTISSIEFMIRDVLDKYSVKYLTQEPIGFWFVDIYIPHKKLIIECNGDYWHNLPDSVERDKLLKNYANCHGYKIIFLWESEIRANPKQTLINGLKEVYANEE